MLNKFTKEEKEIAGGIIGFTLAFGLGMLAQNQISKRKTINSDDILKKVKKEFKKEGPIEGSWIEMTKVPWKKFAYETDVYYGGISRKEENQLIQYEFIADAYSGNLIDVYPV